MYGNGGNQQFLALYNQAMARGGASGPRQASALGGYAGNDNVLDAVARSGWVPGAHGNTPESFLGTNAYKGPNQATNYTPLSSLAKGGTGAPLVTDPVAPYTGPASVRTAPAASAPSGVGAGEYQPAAGLGSVGGTGTANTGIVPPVATPTPASGGSVTPGGDVGYGINVNDYLDPSMQFQMRQGLDALQNSAAARGSLDSGQTLKDILAYSQGLAGTDYNNAFNRAANVRNFNYGVDTGDRDFAYRAASDDWNRTYQPLRDLAQFGLSGTQGAASSDNALSIAIASLLQNAGQIQGTGTIGQGNNVNNTISAILSQLLGGGYQPA